MRSISVFWIAPQSVPPWGTAGAGAVVVGIGMLIGGAAGAGSAFASIEGAGIWPKAPCAKAGPDRSTRAANATANWDEVDLEELAGSAVIGARSFSRLPRRVSPPLPQRPPASDSGAVRAPNP
ncbi:hypothetical protein JCM2811A_06120 [Methylorubrum rhodinum]